MDINTVVNNGFSPKEIIKILTIHFRNLIIAKNPNTVNLITEDEAVIEQIQTQSNHFSETEIISGLNCLDETMQNYTRSINKRFAVELCVMQLCSLSNNDIKKKILIDPPKPKNAIKNLKEKLPDSSPSIKNNETPKKSPSPAL